MYEVCAEVSNVNSRALGNLLGLLKGKADLSCLCNYNCKVQFMVVLHMSVIVSTFVSPAIK